MSHRIFPNFSVYTPQGGTKKSAQNGCHRQFGMGYYSRTDSSSNLEKNTMAL